MLEIIMTVMITIISNNHDNVVDDNDVMITIIITMIMLEMITIINDNHDNVADDCDMSRQILEI